MDAAFFQREILALLVRDGCAYAIKVGFWSWVGLKLLAMARPPGAYRRPPGAASDLEPGHSKPL